MFKTFTTSTAARFFLSTTFTVTFQHHLTQGFSRLSYQVETLDHDFLTAVVTCDSVTKVRMLMATMNTSGFSRFNFTWQIFSNFQQLKARSSLRAYLSYQLSMGRLKTMSDKTSNANLPEGDPPQLKGSSNPQIGTSSSLGWSLSHPPNVRHRAARNPIFLWSASRCYLVFRWWPLQC